MIKSYILYSFLKTVLISSGVNCFKSELLTGNYLKKNKNHEIDYVAQVKDILNLKRNLNSIIGSKITAILFDACILPIRRVASERSCDQRSSPFS